MVGRIVHKYKKALIEVIEIICVEKAAKIVGVRAIRMNIYNVKRWQPHGRDGWETSLGRDERRGEREERSPLLCQLVS